VLTGQTRRPALRIVLIVGTLLTLFSSTHSLPSFPTSGTGPVAGTVPHV
jgi:hypothetical protein